MPWWRGQTEKANHQQEAGGQTSFADHVADKQTDSGKSPGYSGGQTPISPVRGSTFRVKKKEKRHQAARPKGRSNKVSDVTDQGQRACARGNRSSMARPSQGGKDYRGVTFGDR